jgi:hypothetical protein
MQAASKKEGSRAHKKASFIYLNLNDGRWINVAAQTKGFAVVCQSNSL